MNHPVRHLRAFSPADFQLAEKKNTQVAVLVDENTKAHCYSLLFPHLPPHVLIEIRSGEEHKTLETCMHIWGALTQHAFGRQALLINVGGGVIGDMGGFCAATYKRGFSFIQVPTTLLAQVDASVGGKLGVDFQSFKNHIGVFCAPERVLIYPPFLQTLPPREVRSGFAEVLKHALIADASAWQRLRDVPLSEQAWETVIPESVQIKHKVVTADPTEKGLRKILNFGHTIGHAVESFLLTQPERKVLHGEAIAVGMICEAYLSTKVAGLAANALHEITHTLLNLYGKVPLNPEEDSILLELMRQDKKNEAQEINFSLLNRVGEACFNQHVALELIRESLAYYRQLTVLT